MNLEELYGTTGHLLRRAHQMATAVFSAYQSEITGVQYAALSAIADQPGVDATRLSSLIAFDRSTIGGVIDRLEQKGLLSRAADVRDRRVKLLYATPTGRALLEAHDPLARSASRQMLAPLTPADQREFVRMLRILIESHGAPAGGEPQAASPPRRTRSAAPA